MEQMKIKWVVIILVFCTSLFCSCRVNTSIGMKLEESETYAYSEKIKSDVLTAYYGINITLNVDNTFSFQESASIEHYGKWTYLPDNKIKLIFDISHTSGNSDFEKLLEAYNPKGEYTLVILDDNRMKLWCSEWKRPKILIKLQNEY